jgi:hypothetical protein
VDVRSAFPDAVGQSVDSRVEDLGVDQVDFIDGEQSVGVLHCHGLQAASGSFPCALETGSSFAQAIRRHKNGAFLTVAPK